MNILVDYMGHSDQHYSFHRLFETRLGYDMYSPDGEEWLKLGFIKVMPVIPPDELESQETIDGITYYHRKMEPNAGRYVQKGISFEKFLKMDFDAVVTGCYVHEQSLHSLVAHHKPKAKFIRQIANIHEKSLGFCKNLLIGAAYHPNDYDQQRPEVAFKRLGFKYIMYFPEQYEGYEYVEPVNHKLIMNFAPDIASEDRQAWKEISKALEPHGFTFHMFGRGNSASCCPSSEGRSATYSGALQHILLPQAMKDSGFIWYTKPNGGGGFTVRQALASGRPVIVRRRYSSAHSMFECELFKHGVNCIDLDLVKRGVGHDVSMFLDWSEPQRHIRVCKQVVSEYENDTQFEKTAEKIRAWLEGLPKGV